MHTVTIKSISDSTVSNTNSDSYDPHDLMGKVGYSIEQLDIILYQVISCKSKLDKIFRHLSISSEENRSVSICVGSIIVHIERSISNSSVTTYLDSICDKLNSCNYEWITGIAAESVTGQRSEQQ